MVMNIVWAIVFTVALVIFLLGVMGMLIMVSGRRHNIPLTVTIRRSELADWLREYGCTTEDELRDRLLAWHEVTLIVRD